MKKILILSMLIISNTYYVFAQFTFNRGNLIKYFDTAKSLDPIEGLWSLNVITTLYRYNNEIGQQTNEVLSEWAIKREKGLKYQVLNIGEGSKSEKDFDAYFEKTAIDGLYTYNCSFENPNWSVRTNAVLTNGVMLKYDYFVSDIKTRELYGRKYKRGMRVHWQFIWIKIYPRTHTNTNNR